MYILLFLFIIIYFLLSYRKEEVTEEFYKYKAYHPLTSYLMPKYRKKYKWLNRYDYMNPYNPWYNSTFNRDFNPYFNDYANLFFDKYTFHNNE